jgi:hypothetical protein
MEAALLSNLPKNRRKRSGEVTHEQALAILEAGGGLNQIQAERLSEAANRGHFPPPAQPGVDSMRRSIEIEFRLNRSARRARSL